MAEFMIYYTYLWLRYDGTPYYVGKGTRNRAFRKGGPPRDRILIQEYPSEEDAFAAEIFLIAYYGRKDIGTGCLINHTDGGEGQVGVIAWNTGKTLTPEHIAALSAAQRGKKKFRSSEHSQKISENKKKEWARKKELGLAPVKNGTKTSESLRKHYDAISDEDRVAMREVRKAWWASNAGLLERQKRSEKMKGNSCLKLR
jgi:hypothetical protein